MFTISTDNITKQTTQGFSVRHAETTFWVLLLLACNYSLVHSSFANQLVFFPDQVVSGEWHRIFLAPFTHVSWYHFLLDATAFLLLWNSLQESRSWGRQIYFIGCWMGSLVVPLVLSTQVYSIGLCGLSGIAHGLFAITALEMIAFQKDKLSARLGITLLAGLLAKTTWEFVSKGRIMMSMHLGDVGTPILSSHFGGVFGGMLAFGILYVMKKHSER